ncbi:MAG TPA: hypothetical protein VK760_16080 [Candidatus Acidoferrales bacterium]|jgi:hypothetical protein|nr:hypothetical protein [Candidatus Acidoferrales bacterium]
MRNQANAYLGAAVFALGLSACGGIQGSNALPAAGGNSPMAAQSARASVAGKRDADGATTLAITLPPIQPKNRAIDWSSKPKLLSSATQSVAVKIGKTPYGPIKLSSSQSTCQPSSAGRVCTITISTSPRTNAAIALATYGVKTDTADALALGTITQSIFKGQTNVVQPAMSAIVRSYAVQPEHATLTQGFVAGDRLTIYGLDAAGAAIPSNVLVNAAGKGRPKYQVHFSGPVTGGFGAPRACCGTATTFIYDGVLAGNETITATAYQEKTIAGSATVTIDPGSAVSARLLTIGIARFPLWSSPVGLVSAFSLTASGNVAPARTFIPSSGLNIFGENTHGDFWSGSTLLTNRGVVVGTVDLKPDDIETAVAADPKGRLYSSQESSGGGCTITQYPARKFGTSKATRAISVPACADTPHVAVDRAGDVFVGLPSQVLEYGPSGSGIIAPIRTIPLSQTVDHLDVDASGNLYVATGGQLFEFAPGATTGTQLLPSVAINRFAVDDPGDIYVVQDASGNASGSVTYFPAGSTTPSRTLGGSNTMIYSGVVVPRS